MSDSRYPQRHPSHVSETLSRSVFEDALPSAWILRELSGHDYGIDCVVEMVGEELELRGEVAGVQLKGTEQEAGHGPLRVSVKTATMNYWRNHQIPMFVVLVDLKSKRVYAISIEHEIRRRFIPTLLRDPSTLTLKFDQDDAFCPDRFVRQYRSAKSLRRLDDELPSLITLHQEFENLYQNWYGRDPWMSVDDGVGWGQSGRNAYCSGREQRLIRLYNSLKKLSELLEVQWVGPDIEAILETRVGFEHSGGEMMEGHFSLILDNLDSNVKDIRCALQGLMETYSHFWAVRCPVLVQFAYQDYRTQKSLRLKRLEEERSGSGRQGRL